MDTVIHEGVLNVKNYEPKMEPKMEPLKNVKYLKISIKHG